jgi:hypothetical protein
MTAASRSCPSAPRAGVEAGEAIDRDADGRGVWEGMIPLSRHGVE